jgi:hypothetical protein
MGVDTIALIAVPVGLIVFVVAAFHFRRDGWSVRAAYFFSVVFVSLLVALSAFGGLARALGIAVADPPPTRSPCLPATAPLTRGLGGPGIQAQGPPQVPNPPVQTFPPESSDRPGFTFPPAPSAVVVPAPTFPSNPFPTFPAIPVPSFRPDGSGRASCADGRSLAAPEAARSGASFLAALAIGLIHANGARKLVREETPDGG